MSRAGFVLVGGKSSRMGRDKALLPLGGEVLAARVARTVAGAAGSATLVGDPARYASLGFPVIPDRMAGAGPLAGIHTALASTVAAWNLVTACDMPGLETGFLLELLESAERLDADCLLPRGPTGRPEPLCAVYHRRCGPAVAAALERGTRKVTDALRELNMVFLDVAHVKYLQNLNTPEDWLAHARQ